MRFSNDQSERVSDNRLSSKRSVVNAQRAGNPLILIKPPARSGVER